MKPKGVTTQMKALHEYILMVLFVLLLSSFSCKSIDEYILAAIITEVSWLFLHLLEFAQENTTVRALITALSNLDLVQEEASYGNPEVALPPCKSFQFRKENN